MSIVPRATRGLITSAARAGRHLTTTTGAHVPPVHRPEQQSALVAHVSAVNRQRRSHRPFRQNPEQQSAFAAQVLPVGVHVGAGAPAGAPHRAGVPLQSNPQHSALIVQEVPSARHGIWHVSWFAAFGKHLPLQQSALVAQPAPCGRHVPGPKSQR